MISNEHNTYLDDADLVRHVKRIVVRLEAHIRLLLTIGPDEGIDLLGLDIIQASHGILDLLLVSADVNNEHKGVVVLNLLHGRLGGKRVLDDSKGIKLLQLGCTAINYTTNVYVR